MSHKIYRALHNMPQRTACHNARHATTHGADASEIPGIWEPSERENAGKYDRIGGLASTASQRTPKGPHQTVAALERHWTSIRIPKRDFLAGFLGTSSDFADPVDVLERY
jgi:hypothetical protein